MDYTEGMQSFARHRTAMSRTELSKPVSLALADDLLLPGLSFFDFGCGRGGDVKRMSGLGFEASGWDPAHAPENELFPSDIVNIGYVVNVIEDPLERAEALQKAWSLTKEVLIVSARPDWEERAVQGKRFGDGIVTTKGTFQKFFSQEELRSWIETVLDVKSVVAAPGIFYVFRNEARAQGYFASRVRRRPSIVRRPKVSEALYERHRDLLEPLLVFMLERGRLPGTREISQTNDLIAALGSIKVATALVRRVTGDGAWLEATHRAEQDLLVYLALAAFDGRTKFSKLPEDVQLDVKAHFGTYRTACEIADQLLFKAGDQSAISTACASSKIGKLTAEALYIHKTALGQLDPLLRVYEGCGRALVGSVEEANLVKLNRIEPKVSYLAYPDFDRQPHPTLLMSLRADLRRLHVKFRDFSTSVNPPILHRKETLVLADYPGRTKFERLTQQEERAGLFKESARIGTNDGWQQRLTQTGHRLIGHRLVRCKSSDTAENRQ
jgi:DNA phosphorothioation-associated putative methyltransferase